jgi:hypothetical protein
MSCVERTVIRSTHRVDAMPERSRVAGRVGDGSNIL